MAVKFSQFDGTITPVKTSETQFIVGFEGTTNAKWTMKALADEIGGGDNIYIVDGVLSGNRTVTQDGNQLSWDMGTGSQTFTTSSTSGTWMNLRVGGGQKGALLAVSGGGGMYFRDSGGSDYYSVSQNGLYLNRNAGFGITAQANQRLTIKGEGNTNTTYGLRVQNSSGVDTFSVDNTGLVSITGDTANSRLGLRFIPSSSAGGTGQYCKIQDTNGNDWIQKYQGAVSSNRSNILFIGKANGYASENNIVINGPGNVGAPSDNQTNMGDSSLWVWQGGNTYGQYITGKTQDSTSTALLVRNWNGSAGVPSFDTYFQLRNDKRLIYNDGNEAADKVLTCDANGVATWQTAAGGGDSIYTANGTIGATAGNDIRTVTIGGTSQATANHIVIQPPNPSNWGTKIGPLMVRGNGNDVAGFGVYSSHAQISGYGIKFFVNASYGDLGKVLTTAGTISNQGKWTINGDMGLGRAFSTGVKLYVQGDGATSSTRSLLLENASGTYMMSVKDDGQIAIGASATIQSTSNPQYSVVMGYGAKDKASAGNGVEAVAIGRIAVGHQNGVAIGGQAACLGASAVAVGGQAQAKATGVSLGYQAGGATAGSSAVSIGKFAQAKATGSIAIGTNTGLTGANSIVLNATTGVTASTAADTFEVFMSSTSVPDFKVKGTSGGNQASFVGQVSVGVGSGSNATIDFDTGNIQEITIPTETATNFTPTNAVAGSTYIIKITQAGTSGTMNWESSATVNWPGGTAPTLTATSAGVDIITLVCTAGGATGGTFYGTSALNFS